MTNYQNDIMDLLQGNTPKEKYENLLEIRNELAAALGRLEFCKYQFGSILAHTPYLDAGNRNWIESIIVTMNTPLNTFPPLCECGKSRREDSKYCDGCNAFHSI